MTALEQLTVTEPGVYDGMPDDVYHADPVPQGSLSSTGARKLLPPSCPALFRHEQLNGRPPKRSFDLGHAAHHKVLGVGAPIHRVDAGDWRTKKAQEARDAAHASGEVPLLAAEDDQVTLMADAIRAHPIASALFDPARGGKPEQSIFWQDRQQPVWRRARLDWLPALTPSGRLIVPDYKTAICAEPGAFTRSAFNLGYHQQAAYYLDAVRAAGLADDVAFVFVVQEKTAPYLVTICELDDDALRIGRFLNQKALRIYAECQATDTWPGYSTDVELISPPPWLIREFDDVIR